MSSDAVRRTRGTGGANLVLLWFAMLSAPTAWALQLTVAYGIVATGCERHADYEPLVHLTSATAFALALAGLLVALFELAGLPAAARSTPGQRARWMAFTGVLLSGLFLVLIVFGELPVLLLEDHCASAHG